MFTPKFNEIMRQQLPNLNVYEEMAIIQANVNTTNLLLRGLHRGSKETTKQQTSKKAG